VAKASGLSALDAFVSYSSRDRCAAQILVQELEHLGLVVGIDRALLQVGDNWHELLPANIRRSRTIIVLISKSSAAAHFENSEALIAIEQMRRKRARVFPVRLESDAPLPHGLEQLHALDMLDESDAPEVASKIAEAIAGLGAEVGDVESEPAMAAAGRQVVPRLPASRSTLGRSEERDELVRRLVEPVAGPQLILGPPGIGKTNLSISVLHGQQVVECFGHRRIFVRCEAATTAIDLVGELLKAVGLTSVLDDPQHALVTHLRNLERTLLVLDNIETPWESDPLATEEVFGLLAESPNVQLLATMRGAELPGGPTWDSLWVPTLPLDAAREMFLRVTGAQTAGDDLDALLTDMGGLPLAIELLAHAAGIEASIETLRRRWRRERTDVLSRAGGDHRLLSLAASAEVSWSTWMPGPSAS
jgi:hypothetical protein